MFASLKVDKEYSKNQIFDLTLNEQKFDGRGYKYIKLKEEFLKNGVQLNTHDFYKDYSKVDFTIILDGAQFDKKFISKKNYLIAIEPESIHNKNNNHFSRNFYDKIFTWNDNLIDNKVFFKYNFSYDLTVNEIFFFKKKNHKAIMVASKKGSNHKHELYSEREKIISWYDENKSDFFDLYGRGWEHFKFKKYPFTYLNRFRYLTENLTKTQFYKKYNNVYNGVIDNKLEVISNYEFCFCLENINHVEGYITEKIFDSFFSGSIPIYKGASNVESYLPKSTFINLNSFKDLDELNNYLLNDCNTIEFRNNIFEYLSSKKAKEFDSIYNAKKIVKEIIQDVVR